MKISDLDARNIASRLRLEADRLEERMLYAKKNDPAGDWSLDVDPISIEGFRSTAELFSQWVGKTPREKQVLYQAYHSKIPARFITDFRMDLDESLLEASTQNVAA